MNAASDWISVLPALALVLGALAAAVTGPVRPRDPAAPAPRGFLLEAVTCAALGTALGIVVWRLLRGMPAATGFGGAVVLDDITLFLSLAILSAAAMSILLSEDFVRNHGIPAGEYSALVLLASAGMILLVQSLDFATFFVSLEILSLCVYALAGVQRRDPRSNESAIKYFVMGAFASGFLLFGIALLYGATGSTSIPEIAARLRSGPSDPHSLAALGMILLTVGLAFKVGAVPFHMWVPDVYQGAPTAVTAFMAAAVKAAAFGAFLRVVLALGPAPAWSETLAGLAVATMVAGNLLALRQRNVKRMLAYSSVAHAGNVLVGLAAGSGEAAAAAVFHLFAYAFMTMGAFAFLSWMGREGRDAEDLEDFGGLAKRHPWPAAVMTLLLVSLGGLPPTAGFFGKFWIFKAALAEGRVLLVVVGVIATAVSLYYYLRVVVAMTMQPAKEGEGDADRRLPVNAGFVTGVAAAMTLLLGVWPSRFLDLALRSVEQLLSK
jgi:NADH-quinone oxidoreductase subunit N